MSKRVTGLHVQIDADLYEAFIATVGVNDRTHTIEKLIARFLKRKAPEERRRGRPPKRKE